MISTETQRNDYIGNGTTADYDYDFKIFNQEDLLVVVNIDGDETVLVLNTDYTVSDAGEEAGGSISLIDVGQAWIDGSGFLDVGVLLTLTRDVPYLQETDIKNQGDFYPEVHENTFDKLVMQIQQLKDISDRSIHVKITDFPDDPLELPIASERANKFFTFDADGNPAASSVDEFAMDAIGAALTDTDSVNLVYNDALNQISAIVIPGGVDHDLLFNTHNLTTDIDHNQLTNTHNLTTDIDHDTIDNTHNLTSDIDHNTITNTHNLTTDIDHDAIAGYVADEHIPHSSVNLIAGAGLSGGGTIVTNRTFNVDIDGETGVSPATGDELLIADASDSFNIKKITVLDLLALAPAGYTNEEAQDAVGTILTDSSSIDFTYNDGVPSITAVVLPAGVDHNALLNFVANKHIDHTAVVLTAGVGLSGGGDISASRTFDLEDTAVTPASYGSATQVATFTVDQQGRLTAAASVAIAIVASQVTDFNEAAQDAVGGILTDSATIDFTYSDGGNTITATVIQSALSLTASQISDFTEAAQDAVFNAIADSNTIDVTYNDAGNSFSIALDDRMRKMILLNM